MQCFAHIIFSSVSNAVLRIQAPVHDGQRSSYRMCTHVRLGNNESGDFKSKGRGSTNTTRTLDEILLSARWHAAAVRARAGDQYPVSLFVASDSEAPFEYLRDNAPPDWRFLQIAQERPDDGVWFGTHGKNPNTAQMTRASQALNMQIAMADMLSLASCDLFMIPDIISSFQMMPLLVAPARRTEVCVLAGGETRPHGDLDGDLTMIERRREYCYCNLTIVHAEEHHACRRGGAGLNHTR